MSGDISKIEKSGKTGRKNYFRILYKCNLSKITLYLLSKRISDVKPELQNNDSSPKILRVLTPAMREIK